MKARVYCFAFSWVAIVVLSCTHRSGAALFSRLSPDQSGVNFSNTIFDTDSSYSFINEFGYMGGGVGIGDFNNDGLKDIFFTGNQVSSRLYINKGNNKFEDITLKAGVTTNVWATGVSIADVNNDGYDDIYVCVFGKDLKHRAPNLLFINQHDLSFKEQASEYGLADTGYSTQAVFFDYDKDGDLDMYLANYLLTSRNANSIVPRDRTGNSPANDRLFRNDGITGGTGHPQFTDVTMMAGIKEDGFGLGLSVSDFNSDGWPDVYVANDFLSNDELWLNNRDGTFTNCISQSLQHQSYSSMGSDAADINNDGLPDIVTLDMLPEYNERRKTSFSFMNYERYQAERGMGYEPEFMRNMLQLNNGNYLSGDTGVPFFSEIGKLAGIQATDWSWSVLLADFNNDGWKDMHITNGIGRDFINADFLEFSNEIFNSDQSREQQEAAIRKKLSSFRHVSLPNYLYINQGDLTFKDISAAAGINSPSMSNGAAYADLDNDGDLDLVVNNIDEDAFIFINNTVQPGINSKTHFLRVGLAGGPLNTRGIGAKIRVCSGGHVQVQEQEPVRGYFSSVDQQLLFGLGPDSRIDSVTVLWPDNAWQVLTNLNADTLIIFSREQARAGIPGRLPQPPTFFSDITSVSGIGYKHTDISFNDFASQRLLPQKYSQCGPFIATADINTDGMTDFFIGGAIGFSGKIFMQSRGKFITADLTDSTKMEEDMDCIFFDADSDGDPDLLVTGGDVQYGEQSAYYRPRLYINDGKGHFSLRESAIPAGVRTIAGVVCAGDLDGDGDLDLFIGGRVSGTYPLPPRSYILRNDKGVFSDATGQVCPALKEPGMITGAAWADFDHDGQPDLTIAGEWMPLRFFRNEHGQLQEVTGQTGLSETNGMWRSLLATDIDGDGDIDFIAGNLGLNCDYNVSGSMPMELYASDIDGNGSTDPVFFYYIKNKDGARESFPAMTRSLLATQVPAIKKQFLLNNSYAHAKFSDIFRGKATEGLLHYYCNETRTCYFENTGNGKFLKHVLPAEAQFSPVNAIICDDIDRDGFKDLILAGNEYQAEVITGRYDASYGVFLRGSSRKEFMAVPAPESGLVIRGDVKDMSLISLQGGGRLLLAAVNNDSLRVFRINK
ncbi:MAG: VCBS repeat-containing protein [Bacteroidota bacterium]